MRNIKKSICAIAVVVAAVFGTYTTQDTPRRSAPTTLAPEGNPLRFSKRAMEVIGDAEGCRRDPYMCPANRLTAGIGHAGKDVRAGVGVYSLEQITKWYAEDLFGAQECLEKYVEDKLGKQLPPGVFDAFGSFVFNMGCAKFRSYPVYTLLLKQEYSAACARLPLYVYGGGVKLPGLVDRRGKEKELCLAQP